MDKVLEAPPSYVSRCGAPCYKSSATNCSVLDTSQRRDFSRFIPHKKLVECRNQKTIRAKQRFIDDEDAPDEEVYFPYDQLKALHTWYLDFIKNSEVWMPVFTKMLADMKYGSEDLKPIKFAAKLPCIPFRTLDKCYLVRYKNPWDFHVILEADDNSTHEIYQLKLDANWKAYFPEKDMHFCSGLDLFVGLTCILSKYMALVQKNRKFWGNAKHTNYEQGDLVICLVPRKNKHNDKQKKRMLGYRAVVLQVNLKVVKEEGSMVTGACLTLYLLDTGEKRVVEQNSAYLTPLPKAFSGICPLAIPCALHGISPVGLEWSNDAVMKMKRVVIPDGKMPQPMLLCEFYYSSSNKKYASTRVVMMKKLQKLLDGLMSLEIPREKSQPWEMIPYFVELTVRLNCKLSSLGKTPKNPNSKYKPKRVQEEWFHNVTTELLKLNLGLRWNLFPSHPEISRPEFNENKDKISRHEFYEKKDSFQFSADLEDIEREDHLHVYTEDAMLKMKTPERRTKAEMRIHFENAYFWNKDLHSQMMFIDEENDDTGNVLAMTVRLPNIKRECLNVMNQGVNNFRWDQIQICKLPSWIE